ncbi:MAG: RidA family protein [Acidimicrobiales bacterium]
MERRIISQGSSFEERYAYSRAVVQGPWVFVSGTTGYDYSTMTISDDPAEQTAQTLRNIDAAIVEVGATAADIVRVNYFLPDVQDFEACGPAIRDYFADIRPAATMVECGLIVPELKIEIEVTALRQ